MANLKRSLFGYSSSSVRSALADREQMFERASDEARAAGERAEALEAELSGASARTADLQERLDAAEVRLATLAAELERAAGEREAISSDVIALQQTLENAHAELREARDAIVKGEEELGAAETERARLAEELRAQTERADRAAAEAATSQHALERALEESASYKGSLAAQQVRVGELEDLVARYREQIEQRSATAMSVDVSERRGPDGGPSTADELAATVLDLTERAVQTLVESTRARADEELRAVDAERARINQDVEALTAWRDGAVPVVDSLRRTVDDVRRQIGQVGPRIEDALRPVTAAVAEMSSQLSSLDALSLEEHERIEPREQTPRARVIELRDDNAGKA